jgi:hypothetical protein
VTWDTWKSQRVWFYGSIASVNAMYFLVRSRLCPKFNYPFTPGLMALSSRLWAPDTDAIVARKRQDRKRYVEELAKLFGRQLPVETEYILDDDQRELSETINRVCYGQ